MKNINNIQKAKEIKKEEFYQLDIESQIYLICKFPNLLYRFPNYIYENYDLFYLLIEKHRIKEIPEIFLDKFGDLIYHLKNNNSDEFVLNCLKLIKKHNFKYFHTYDEDLYNLFLIKLSDENWKNKEIVEKILIKFPNYFNNLNQILKNDIEFLYSIFIQNPKIWIYFDNNIKINEKFMNSEELYKDDFLEKVTIPFPVEFQNDKKFFINKINKENYLIFNYADKKLKTDIEFLYKLIKKNANIINLIPKSIKTAAFIKKAISVNSNVAINNDIYKIKDFEYAIELINKKTTALAVIDKKLFQNLDFIKFLIEKFENDLQILNKYLEKIDNLKVIKYLLKINSNFYKKFNKNILNNLEIAKYACKLNEQNIKYVSSAIYNNEKSIKDLLDINNAIIQYIPNISMREKFKYEVDAKYIFLTQTELLNREKWNKTKIDYFLGEPDKISETDAYGKKMPVYLFNLEKIKKIEALENFPNYRKPKITKNIND